MLLDSQSLCPYLVMLLILVLLHCLLLIRTELLSVPEKHFTNVLENLPKQFERFQWISEGIIVLNFHTTICTFLKVDYCKKSWGSANAEFQNLSSYSVTFCHLQLFFIFRGHIVCPPINTIYFYEALLNSKFLNVEQLTIK